MSYYFTKITSLGYEQALMKVEEELKKDGFGIITEIDVRETLKKKLNVVIGMDRLSRGRMANITCLPAAGIKAGAIADGVVRPPCMQSAITSSGHISTRIFAGLIIKAEKGTM